MAGLDDNISVFGDWSASNPSPRTFFTSCLGSSLLPDDGSEIPLMEPEKQKSHADSWDRNEEFEFETVSGTYKGPSNVPNVPKPRLGGGLAERVATKAGFNALKINISHVGTVNLSSPSSDSRSCCVTIPPGLSPTTLLESPVFLFNNLIQPSPTTGKFSLGQCTDPCSMTSEVAHGNKASDVDSSSDIFSFKPGVDSDNSQNMVSVVNKQPSLISGDLSSHPNFSGQSDHLIVREGDPWQWNALEPRPMHAESSENKCQPVDYQSHQKAYDSAMRNEDEKELKGDTASAVPEQQSEDGYNWRKYGQKQVKGSEHPRSYYKCTYPNCEVKKKVERSPEGLVVEIIYKGKHIHPKPPPNRRTSPSPFNAFGELQVDGPETSDPLAITESKPMWRNPPSEIMGQDCRNDGLDASSSVSMAAEFCNASPSISTPDDPHFESPDAIDDSSTVSNEEDEQGIHQNASPAVDGDEDESDSKRRKLENSIMDVTAAARAVNREPRVVVQTTSEVDILDDGYRWRKYGQKVVKGNPNPRSYYKCTSAGCPVRKHVERASHDLKSVITTYEGKHNHEVPAARNSGNSSSNSSSVGGSSFSQSHGINKRQDHTQMPDGYARFDIPTIGSFGMRRVEQPRPSPGFSFGLGQAGIANLAMSKYGNAFQAKTMLPLHSYFGQHPGSEAGMVLPKGEPDEPMAGSSMPISNNAAVYQQFMGGLTLGPQM